MKFEIGKPEHGWVTIRAELGGSVIEFVASDVPNNPISNLIDAIRVAAEGREASVWWNLEPDGWYFEFEPTSEGLSLRALFSPNSVRSAAELRAEVLGSKASILLPLWRGLRRFESFQPGEPHWPELDGVAISSLRSLIE